MNMTLKEFQIQRALGTIDCRYMIGTRNPDKQPYVVVPLLDDRTFIISIEFADDLRQQLKHIFYLQRNIQKYRRRHLIQGIEQMKPITDQILQWVEDHFYDS